MASFDGGSNGLGTIQGSVENLESDFHSQQFQDPDAARARLGVMREAGSDVEIFQIPGQVTLESADITASAGGVFRGTTSGAIGTPGTTTTQYQLSGHWGGLFPGNGANPTDHPDLVVGTIGAGNEAGRVGLGGWFLAGKN